MTGTVSADVTLPAETTTVGRARRAVRQALSSTGGTHLQDVAELMVSELVTNAVVHAGTPVGLRIAASAASIRVEVEDGSPHLPVRRHWADTAGTGRGLMIVEAHADRWGAARTGGGKTVWFEIGEATPPLSPLLEPAEPAPAGEVVDVVLHRVPLLMHWAWQEHASTLLREFLLYTIDRDAAALGHHAAASDALSILHTQLPTPDLPRDPEALIDNSVEPTVTAHEVLMRVPAVSIGNFRVLDDLLIRAVAAARDGLLLGPPTQPEMAEMRHWLCGEVTRQAERAEPTPWRARTDVRLLVEADLAWGPVHRALAESHQPLIATNDAGIIVSVTASALELLGYDAPSDLLGRRILVVVPARFHQAHIAGTTLHATNGRDVLLNHWITVPMVRADGSETMMRLRVEPGRTEGDAPPYFVAQFQPASANPTEESPTSSMQHEEILG